MNFQQHDIVPVVTSFLTSLKRSIARSDLVRGPQATLANENTIQLLVKIEETLIRLRMVAHTRSAAKKRTNDLQELLNDLMVNLGDRNLVPRELLEIPFDQMRIANTELTEPLLSWARSPVESELKGLINNRKYIGGAIEELHQIIQHAISQTKLERPLKIAERIALLDRIVPEQKIAPLKFEIVDERLRVVSQSSIPNDVDLTNISSAHEHIAKTGAELVLMLEATNCDRRLVETVQNVHSQILDGNNIVKLGLSNLACAIMASQYEAELSPAVAAELFAFNSGVGMYIAQFPEWEQFAKNAASISASEEDVRDIVKAADNVVAELNKHPDLTDPLVPATIKVLSERVSNPRKASKQAFYAVLTTLENLVSVTVKYCTKLLSNTAEETSTLLAKTASKVIVGFLCLAFVSASGIGPVAATVGAPWLQKASEMIGKQLEALTPPPTAPPT